MLAGHAALGGGARDIDRFRFKFVGCFLTQSILDRVDAQHDAAEETEEDL